MKFEKLKKKDQYLFTIETIQKSSALLSSARHNARAGKKAPINNKYTHYIRVIPRRSNGVNDNNNKIYNIFRLRRNGHKTPATERSELMYRAESERSCPPGPRKTLLKPHDPPSKPTPKHPYFIGEFIR